VRRDPVTEKSVPDTLGELLEFFQGEFDPKLIGGIERKEDLLLAIRDIIDRTPGGKKAKLSPLPFEAMVSQLVVMSGRYARARIRERQEQLEPNDDLMQLAGAVVATGDRQKMLAFADRLDEALRHPTVHPERKPGINKLAEWVRMNARGNC